MRNAMLAIIGAFALAGCSKSVEGMSTAEQNPATVAV